ncbi:MAG: GAF domain-containing protein [Terriglobales bacterium]
MIQSQRHSVRLPVRTLVCNLDHWNEATILNVSEGGMALQAMAPVNMSRPVQVILDCAESSGSIVASGEVAWNHHGRAGVRFSKIGETSRDRLIEWLYQDVAARCVRRENPFAVQRPHGLTLPVPGLGHAADMPSFNGNGLAAAGPDGPGKLRLTALLTAEHQLAARGLELPALLDLLAKRARCITHASGAAIALGTSRSAVCMAKSGTSAPDLGITIASGRSLSGECLRSGAIMRCNDVDSDRRVDPENCRRLGIRSALLLPLFNAPAAVTGVLGVFSERPSAFDDYDVVTLQRMTDVIMAASRLSASAPAALR